MNGKLDNLVEVNGSLLIEVIDDKIKLTTPNNSVTMPFDNIDELGDVSDVLDSKLGSKEILLTSDIYDLYEYKAIRCKCQHESDPSHRFKRDPSILIT